MTASEPDCNFIARISRRAAPIITPYLRKSLPGDPFSDLALISNEGPIITLCWGGTIHLWPTIDWTTAQLSVPILVATSREEIVPPPSAPAIPTSPARATSPGAMFSHRM